MMRKDRNRYGEEVFLYTQNYIYLQRRDDLCVSQVEVIWYNTNKVAILITNAYWVCLQSQIKHVQSGRPLMQQR